MHGKRGCTKEGDSGDAQYDNCLRALVVNKKQIDQKGKQSQQKGSEEGGGG